MTPYIFISYSQNDKDYVHKLSAELNKRGFVVWYAKHIDYGSPWPSILQEKVDNCGALILIMTSYSYDSEWVQNELSRAQRKQKPIFPLLLEGEEPWLSVEIVQYVDVKGGRLPPSSFYQRISKFVQPQDSPFSIRKEHIRRVNVEQEKSEKLDAIVEALEEIKQKQTGRSIFDRERVSLRVGNISVDYYHFSEGGNIKAGWSAWISLQDSYFRPLINLGWSDDIKSLKPSYHKNWHKDIADMKIIANDLMEANISLGITPDKVEIVIKYG